MSFKYEDHRLLYHLDNPKRILYWTMDEFGVAAGPIFLGMIMSSFYLGIIGAAICFYLVRKIKRRLGHGGNFKLLMYWYLGVKNKDLRAIPHSYVREYIG